MSRVKIDVPGWEHFNGLFGFVMFENGVSTRELTEMEIKRIGANIRIVAVDTDEQLGIAVDMVKTKHVAATVVPALKTLEEPIPVVSDDGKYTREQLEDIAEKGGIKAMREVANKFGIKGVQISLMIEQILEAQSSEV